MIFPIQFACMVVIEYWKVEVINKKHWFLWNKIFDRRTYRPMQQQQQQRKLLCNSVYYVVKLPMTLYSNLCTKFDCLSPLFWSKRLHVLHLPFSYGNIAQEWGKIVKNRGDFNALWSCSTERNVNACLKFCSLNHFICLLFCSIECERRNAM